MSRVSIVADGPFFRCKPRAKNDGDEVGGVVKVARTLVDVSPCVFGTGYIREIELSAVESLSSECTGCCDARTNTEFYSACKQNVSIVADGPISGEELEDSRRPKLLQKIHVKMRWVRCCFIKVVLDLPNPVL